MSFIDAIKSYFKNYANFKGRARRSEFWYAILFYAAVSIFILIIFPPTISSVPGYSVGMLQVEGYQSVTFSPVSDLWGLANLVPYLAIIWRRLHDVSKSGPYFFFIFIPIAGAIMLLIQLVKDSTPGANPYGAPVK
jgi:uncharacterized membrane protein YhaH (DUF805 family)